MHEGRGYRFTFQRARVASSPEVPKVTWWKLATFLGYHLHWLGIFLAMFRECLCVVARQLAPKCRDFSNVAKLARQCKWPCVVETSLGCVNTHKARTNEYFERLIIGKQLPDIAYHFLIPRVWLTLAHIISYVSPATHDFNKRIHPAAITCV